MPGSVIVVDIDNTIADTHGELLRRFNVPADRYPCPAVPNDFFGTPEGIKLLDSACPFPGAAAALRSLRMRGHWVVYATGRPVKALAVTGSWLRSNGFPAAPIFAGLSVKEKLDLADETRPAAFFEDDPATVKGLAVAGHLILMKDWPYNRNLVSPVLIRFDEWNQALSMLASRGKEVPLRWAGR
jgi:hypothetical protein